MSGFRSSRPFARSALALLLLCSCGGPRASDFRGPRPAALVVTRGDLDERFLLTGELQAVSAERLVVPRTSAWLLSIRWLAEDGSSVRRGDPVVEFDGSSFGASLEDKRLAAERAASEVRAERARGAAAVTEAAMQVDRAQAALGKAELEANVPTDLFPRREYQERQLELARAQRALARARDELAAARRVALAEADIRQVGATRAERDLSDLELRLRELTLRAPRDGLVQIASHRQDGRKFLVGDQVMAGWTVASLPDLESLQVQARLPDLDDGAVREGMPVEGGLDALPERRFRGVVRQVSPLARPDARDATRRFFDVTIVLETQVEVMRPGMSLRVEVIRRQARGALLIPRAALPGQAGKIQVNLTGGGERTVEIDWCNELTCVVRGQLPVGTRLRPPTAAGGPSS
jgi:HlyD family secretion protein